MIFQSTQPKRAATVFVRLLQCSSFLFQSTQPKRAATISAVIHATTEDISIHAAQEGCDIVFLVLLTTSKISIHAAQEGCDLSYW